MSRLLACALLFNFTCASTCWSGEAGGSVGPDRTLRASIRVLKVAHQAARCDETTTACDANELRTNGLRTLLASGAVIVLTVGSIKISERVASAAVVAAIRQAARMILPAAIAAGGLGAMIVIGSYVIGQTVTPAGSSELTDDIMLDEAHFSRLLTLDDEDIHVIASHRPRVADVIVRSAAAILDRQDEPSAF